MAPIAITTIPVTEVVAQVLASGLLERRLALGLEEICITEHAFAVMPALARPLRDLARRYPRRLVLVPEDAYTELYRNRPRDPLRFGTEAAREYLLIGSYLTEAYEERYEQAAKALPLYRWRIGTFPEEVRVAILHELIVEAQAWVRLDPQDMARRLADNKSMRLMQRARARAVLRNVLKENG